jgi:hypothetical protein
MKYEQPYGVSDPNASYINGNPSTGTMGSIPPAASIENPQREIVNTITDAGIAATDADLHQLAKAIQSGQLNFKHDTGTANAYATSLVPNPGSYFEGLSVILKVGNLNTGASVLNINSIGNAPIVRADGSPLTGGELIGGQYVLFLFDGTSWRMVWATSGSIAGMPVWLTKTTDFYVNGTTGNDAWDGTSATFVSGKKGPFQTLQRAANEYPKYNLNGYMINIHVAGGTYAKVSCGPANGSGQVNWVGNPASPTTVAINAASGSAVIIGLAGPPMQFDGFTLTSGVAIPGDPGFGIWVVQGAQVITVNLTFGAAYTAHIGCSEATLTIDGAININGVSQICLDCDGGRIILNAVTLPVFNFNIGMTYAAGFVNASNVGRVVGPGVFNGIANVGGPKYFITGNGILNTFGQGVAAWPGNQPGVLSTGGQAF